MSILQSVEFDAKYGAEHNPNFENADGWTCTIGYKGNKIEVPFYMGVGHYGRQPQKEEVLDTLFMDAESTDLNFDEWCAELGYDDDSIRALEVYKACKRIAEDLDHLFGNDFEVVRVEVQEYAY